MRIEHIYRYPVKGLTPEAMEEADVEAGGALPWDRAFALAQGDAPFDAAQPEWLQKSNFMCLMRNARIARLRAAFDPAHRVLTIRAPDGDAIAADPTTMQGRDQLGAFLSAYLGEEARGAPRFHHVPGHVFGDSRQPTVTLINLATVAAFGTDVGAERDRMRFRANLYLAGAAPWSEFDWVGRELQVGTARLRVFKRTIRCAATQVNPVSAERDADPMRELRTAYGHTDLGVHAEVIEGGRFALGDAVEVLPV